VAAGASQKGEEPGRSGRHRAYSTLSPARTPTIRQLRGQA
jgi:hypothetical protein